MIKKPINPEQHAINAIPIILKNPPIRKSMLHLPRLRKTKANPSKAATQKLSPFKAI